MGDLPADSADLTKALAALSSAELHSRQAPGSYVNVNFTRPQMAALLRSTRTAVPGPDQVVVDREALTVVTDMLKERLKLEDRPASLATRMVRFWREDLDVIADALAALSPDPSKETL